MAHVHLRPGWQLPERAATPDSVYFGRRAFLRKLGLGGAALTLSGCFTDFEPAGIEDVLAPDGHCDDDPPRHPLQTICAAPNTDLYPLTRRTGPTVPDDEWTDRVIAARHNNFYEFIGNQGNVNSVWGFMGPFRVWPWTVDVAGEAENTGTFDVAALERSLGLEERIYRHRCVERWSMVVPWAGFPLAALVEHFRPLSSARYVRFVSFDRPDQAVGQVTQPWYPWPYFEALRMDEALNELAFVATGIFGEPLPKQHGAPWRLVLPWKYGFKSAKSVVRIEFLREQPETFWPVVWPEEYGFYSNVNPSVDHPRWSQEFEQPLGTFEPRQTELFNGYGDWVADLYDPELLTYIS